MLILTLIIYKYLAQSFMCFFTKKLSFEIRKIVVPSFKIDISKVQ